MLFAKLALGFCGTVAVAGAYTFHDGIMRVDQDQSNGQHVHVWLPAAIVPIAMHVVPSRHLSRAAAQAAPWLPTLRALTKELKRYPDAELVEVEDANQHVRIRTQHGRLLIDVTEPDESVHVACPLAMIEDVARQLEAQAPVV
jgi:NAD(P)H-flavin reductase